MKKAFLIGILTMIVLLVVLLFVKNNIEGFAANDLPSIQLPNNGGNTPDNLEFKDVKMYGTRPENNTVEIPIIKKLIKLQREREMANIDI